MAYMNLRFAQVFAQGPKTGAKFLCIDRATTICIKQFESIPKVINLICSQMPWHDL